MKSRIVGKKSFAIRPEDTAEEVIVEDWPSGLVECRITKEAGRSCVGFVSEEAEDDDGEITFEILGRIKEAPKGRRKKK